MSDPIPPFYYLSWKWKPVHYMTIRKIRLPH